MYTYIYIYIYSYPVFCVTLHARAPPTRERLHRRALEHAN
jgi:hypothetical protein